MNGSTSINLPNKFLCNCGRFIQRPKCLKNRVVLAKFRITPQEMTLLHSDKYRIERESLAGKLQNIANQV